jgi:hypothetical protein
MARKYTNIFHYKTLENFQIGIFGLKINHLATLEVAARSYRADFKSAAYIQPLLGVT